MPPMAVFKTCCVLKSCRGAVTSSSLRSSLTEGVPSVLERCFCSTRCMPYSNVVVIQGTVLERLSWRFDAVTSRFPRYCHVVAIDVD